jgi:hypothetical protein
MSNKTIWNNSKNQSENAILTVQQQSTNGIIPGNKLTHNINRTKPPAISHTEYHLFLIRG